MADHTMLIDCDPGLDDAIALLTAAHLADVVGITTVNGNVGLAHTTRNALAITQIADLDIPVHQGADRPLRVPMEGADHVHGASGLGDVEIPDLDRSIASDDAVDFILETSHRVANLHLVAIGPLTNVANAFTADPTLGARLAGLTVMGGAAQGGNVTAVAEFNIWADPEAADIVFRAHPSLTMVGLDVTHRVLLGPDERDRLRAARHPAAMLAADLLEYAVARSGEIRGWAGAPIHDACAILAVTHPDLFGGARRHVEVETEGTATRGMTVVDQRGSEGATGDVLVLTDVDRDAVVATIVEAVIALGAS